MAKARPKIPGKKPGTPEDPDPSLGKPRPGQRDKVYEMIGKVIIEEWKSALGRQDGQMDRGKLEGEISKHLRLQSKAENADEGDPMGQVEIGIVLDPKPEAGRKFVWIVVPYPEYPESVKTDADKEKWLKDYDVTLLGEAVLFGCGR